jgi:predicted AlkP superfamily phosphohydrolase/phosphomutase
VPRVLVVGFDGATLELAQRWQSEDRMPAFASICADGSYGTLRSTFPYNSAVAWASLCTGVNPGRHGIFDFVLPRVGEYRLRVATREDRRVPALWSYASDAGARVGVVNIPMTFPAEAVNGVMVSGMDAPMLDERAVHPSDFVAQLRQMQPDYRIISNAHRRAADGDFDGAERELIEAVEARGAFTAELARPRDLDLIMVNLEATDGAQHFFWQHFDPAHPRHDPKASAAWRDTIGRVYQAVDRELGRIVDAYAPDTVFVVSDHGGGPSNDWIVFMNDWLAAEGFLSMRRRRGASVARRAYGETLSRISVPLKRRLRPLLGGAIERVKGMALYGDVDWTASRAFATVQPMVLLNRAGREPQGVVADADADRTLDEIAARADALRRPDGGRVFDSASRGAQVYQGDAPGGPDLVVDPVPGLEVKGRNTGVKPGHVLHLRDLGGYSPSGLHTPVGLVAAAGAGVQRRGRAEESDIHQVAASVLAVMGVPAPTLDAGPFAFVSSDFRSTGAAPTSTSAAGTDFSAEEEEEILDRLRGLGYVD